MDTKIIYLEEVRKKQTYHKVRDLFLALEEDSITLRFQECQLKLLLEEVYQLYLSKNIIYQYSSDMILYFSTICDDIISGEMREVKFSDVMQGVVGCHQLMSPVEIEKRDLTKVISKVKRKNLIRKGGDFCAR